MNQVAVTALAGTLSCGIQRDGHSALHIISSTWVNRNISHRTSLPRAVNGVDVTAKKHL